MLGANQRIGVGLIGFGLIGRFHLAALKEQPDVQVTAVCDVHRGRVAAAAEMAGGNAASTAISANCSTTSTSTPSMSPRPTIGTR